MKEQTTDYARTVVSLPEASTTVLHDKCHCTVRCLHCRCGHHRNENAEPVAASEPVSPLAGVAMY